MAFKHVRTDDPHTPASDSRARLLEKLLVRHAADGFDVLELRRQMGKRGYVATEHRWEDDGCGDDLTDEDGGVLLIGGMSPADLADDLVDTARQHVEETNDRRNYRVVALRREEDEDTDADEVEVFRLLLPATMFGAVPDAPSSEGASSEHHDALMAANQQLQRQLDVLFRMLMDVVRQYPTVLGKSTALMEQLGDQLGGGRQQDLQQVLAILEFESTRDQRWMEHDRAKQRAGHRAGLLEKTFDVAGPDLMTLMRALMEMVMTAGATPSADASTDTTTPPRTKTTTTTATPSPPPSSFAHRLDQALSKVPAEGLQKAKALLDEDEWSLLEAARRASSDEEFAAIVAKLREVWTAKGEAATQARMQQLVDALGMPAAMTLGQLIQQAQGH